MSRHWLWYKTDGTIAGAHSLWSSDGIDEDAIDPNDSETTNPYAVQMRDMHASDPDHSGWHEYDCVCVQADGLCGHGADRAKDSYIDTDTLTTKPAVDMVVDTATEPVNTDESAIDKTPAATVTFKLKENVVDEVPDGTAVEVRCRGVDLYSTKTFTLTFTDGETNEVSLVAPPKGLCGHVDLGGQDNKLIDKIRLFIRGW